MWKLWLQICDTFLMDEDLIVAMVTDGSRDDVRHCNTEHQERNETEIASCLHQQDRDGQCHVRESTKHCSSSSHGIHTWCSNLNTKLSTNLRKQLTKQSAGQCTNQHRWNETSHWDL